MVDIIQTSKPKSGALLWFWCLLIFALVALCFVSPDYLITVLAKEALQISGTMGQSCLNKIDSQTSSLYNALFVNSGIFEHIGNFYSLSDKADTGALTKFQEIIDALSQWSKGRAVSLMIALYLMIERLFIILLWGPFLILAVAQGVFTGVMRRKIKQASFSFSSPTLNRSAVGTMVTAFLMLPTFMVLPIPLNPYVVPVVFILISFMIATAIGNLAKRL